MNKPQIRFKGFDEEWEVKSLSDKEFDIQAGGDVDKTMLKSAGQFPVIANALTNNGILGFYDEYYRIKAPAVTVTGRGDVGVAVPRRENFTPVVRLLTVTSPYDIDFLANVINNHPLILESTGVPQLTVPKLQSYQLFIPQLREQHQIGEYFRRIDEMIVELEREVSRVEKLKQASLQKMFPRPGQTTPQIRFKGFEGEWKVCRLNEICSYSSSSLSVSSASKNGNYPLFDANNQIGYTDFARIPVTFISIIKDGAGVGRCRILPSNSFIIGTLGAIVPNTDTDLYFLFQVMNNLRLGQKISGSTIPHIYFSEYGLIEIPIPKPSEQQAIGEYFRNLDNMLSAKRQKLIKLRNIKKACLAKMFVS